MQHIYIAQFPISLSTIIISIIVAVIFSLATWATAKQHYYIKGYERGISGRHMKPKDNGPEIFR